VFKKEKHRIVEYIEQRAREGLAELDALPGAEQGIVLEGKVEGDRIEIEVEEQT
jgi:hypothetical protein